MRIAVLTSGILPVPAVQGGAVENLVDFYLEYNDKHHLHEITVYSCYHHNIKKHPALKSSVNHYYYVDTTSIIAKIRKRLYLRRAGGREFHHFSIEFFIKGPFSSCHLSFLCGSSRLFYTTKRLFSSFQAPILRKRSHFYVFVFSRLQVHDEVFLSVIFYMTICRESLGLSSDDFVLVFSGRVTKEKGISELLDAILTIKNICKVKLLVIGSSFYGGSNAEDTFIHSLKEKAECIPDRIIFTGFISYDKMPDYLRISDIAVIPSIWDDPFPTTVLEAQAMGLPIITTRRGGIPEEITEENAVLLSTDKHFVENLANAILDLYQHPEKRTAMAKASLKRSKFFNKETYAENFFNAIDTM